MIYEARASALSIQRQLDFHELVPRVAQSL